jgi:hypothetical protein
MPQPRCTAAQPKLFRTSTSSGTKEVKTMLTKNIRVFSLVMALVALAAFLGKVKIGIAGFYGG